MKAKILSQLFVAVTLWMGLCGGALPAWAAPATTTNLAVTSGGIAVTTVAPGTVVALTATVNAGTNAVTIGQVKFCDAAASYCTDIHLLGTAQLTRAGTATLKFAPGVGSHSYKAVFVGTASDAASSSGAAALTVSGPLYATTTTLVREGKGGYYTLTATVAASLYEKGLSPPTGTVSFVDTSAGNAVLGTALLGMGVSALGWLNTLTSATGNSPSSVAIGDFNGDGIPDLAVTNESSNTVTILLGNGNGTFTAAGSLATGVEPYSVAVGDFNGDGIPDLAVASYFSHTVTILLGNGDGTFHATWVSPAVGNQVAVGDFNGDGKPDLAVLATSVIPGTVTILLGNGDGTFTPVAATSPSGTFPTSIAVGDFNGDGKADLVVTDRDGGYEGSATILLGKGDGTFTAAASPDAGYGPESVAVGDFNGDGKADLAIADSGGVKILLGNGDGTFTGSSVSENGADFQAIAVGDFNGDGKADLGLANYVQYGGNTVVILLGNGDGTFQAPSAVPVAGASSIAVADFNGDGISDVPTGSSISNTVTALLTQLTEKATATVIGISPLQAGPDQVVASYPGDSTYAGSVSSPTLLYEVQPPPQATTTTLAMTSKGIAVTTVSSGSMVTLTATVTAGGAALTVGQVNFCDAAATHCTDIHLLGTAQLTSQGTAVLKFVPGVGSHSYRAVFTGTYTEGTSASSAAALTVTSTGKFPTATTIAQSGTVGNYTLTATVGGAKALAAPTGIVSFLDTSNGNFVLGTATLVTGASRWFNSQSPAAGDTAASVVVADFNRDGIPDLAVADLNANTVVILLGNGDGTFTAAPTALAADQTTFVAVGDFNRDGIPDLAVTVPGATNPGTVTILLGKGDGTFTTAASPIVSSHPQGIALGDFNGDGIQDLAVVNYDQNTVTILLGNGDGTFAAAAAIPAAGPNPYFVAVGDFNGDGIQDLAVADSGGSTLTIFLGHGDGTFYAAASPATGRGPAAVAIGDFNGDGIQDLAVPNLHDNTVTILLGKGDGTFYAAASPATGSGPVYIAIGDFNGDGIPDLAVTNLYGNTVTILQGKGNGTFAAAASPATGSAPDAVAVGDFNGDGIADLAVANFGNPNGSGGSTVTVLLATEEASTATANGISPRGSGTHQVEASYGGDADYFGSISPTLPLTASSGPLPMVSTAAATSISGSGATIYGLVNANGTSATVWFEWGTSSTLASFTQCTSLAISGTATTYESCLLTGLTSGTTYYYRIAASNSTGTVKGSILNFTAQARDTSGALQFIAMTPCRVADTRNATGPFGGPSLGAKASRNFVIPSSTCGIPAVAAAYSLNVTVVPHGGLGYLTVWPSGQAQPLVSTLNSIDGRIKANAAIVPAGTGGAVSVYVTDATDVVLDINGYFVPGPVPSGLAFYPLTPCRIADTRLPNAPLGGPYLVGGQSRTLPILSSSCQIPSSAQAYSLNFTAVPRGSLGFLSAWPAGQTWPGVSTLNAPTATVTANAAIVPAGSNGAINVMSATGSNTDVVIDINGYFAPAAAGGLSLYTVTPCRVLDTRTTSGSFKGTLAVDVKDSSCGVPPSAQAFVLNATVVPAGPTLGYLTLWPNGQTQPLVSTLNALDGMVTSNLAIVPTANGSINAFSTDATQLVLDVNGYIAP